MFVWICTVNCDSIISLIWYNKNNAISSNLFVPIAHAGTLINPRCACAARVTVLGQSVCLSVRCYSGTTTTGYELHQPLRSNKDMDIKMAIFQKSLRLRVMAWNTSEKTNMQMSMAYFHWCVCTVGAQIHSEDEYRGPALFDTAVTDATSPS